MYDRKAIMNRAWAIHRDAAIGRAARRAQGETFPPERKLFGNALRTAWREAKEAIRVADLATRAAAPVEPIREAIRFLNAKDFWRPTDHARHTELTSQLRSAA